MTTQGLAEVRGWIDMSDGCIIGGLAKRVSESYTRNLEEPLDGVDPLPASDGAIPAPAPLIEAAVMPLYQKWLLQQLGPLAQPNTRQDRDNIHEICRRVTEGAARVLAAKLGERPDLKTIGDKDVLRVAFQSQVREQEVRDSRVAFAVERGLERRPILELFNNIMVITLDEEVEKTMRANGPPTAGRGHSHAPAA